MLPKSVLDNGAGYHHDDGDKGNDKGSMWQFVISRSLKGRGSLSKFMTAARHTHKQNGSKKMLPQGILPKGRPRRVIRTQVT